MLRCAAPFERFSYHFLQILRCAAPERNISNLFNAMLMSIFFIIFNALIDNVNRHLFI